MRRAIPDKRMSAEQGRVQMASFLYSCRPEKLAAITAGELVRLYRVTEAQASEALGKARASRGALL